MKTYITNNKKQIIFFSTLLISIFLLFYYYSINHSDIIWNYNFSKKIAEGYVPYRDFNVLQTPLFFYIVSIFLRIFGNTLLTAIIVNLCLAFINCIVMYKICMYLSKDQDKSILIIFLYQILNIIGTVIYYSYNDLCQLFILITIYLELKNTKKKCNYIDYILGLIIGLTILTKQSVGAILALSHVLYILLQKETLKTKVITITKRALIALLVVGTYIFYLYKMDALNDFIDFTILGMKSFDEKNSFFDISGLSIYLLVICLYLTYTAVMQYKKKKDNNALTMLVYLIPMIIISYPIFDVIHFKGVFTLCMIFMIYAVDKIKVNYLLLNIILLLTVSAKVHTQYKNYVYIDSKVYKYLPTMIENKITLEEVTKYILEYEKTGNEIIVVDAIACFYTIELDRNYKYFDMLLEGNIGETGEEKVISIIKSKKDKTKFLIRNDYYPDRSQETLKVINHIKNTYKKVDSIMHFDVYEK